MDLHILEHDGITIAETAGEGLALETVQDAVDLVATARYQGAQALSIQQAHLPPAFFVLRSGLAGEVLQKFTNDQVRLVIEGDFDAVESEVLRAFLRESNRGRQVAFVPDRAAALARLSPARR